MGDWRRLEDIGVVLGEMRRKGTAPHVVAIQEGWFSDRVEPLVRASGYQYVKAGPGQAFGHVTGSGLYILSDFPLTDEKENSFQECAGADCLSRKSVMSVRVRIPGLPEPFIIFNS